MKEDNTQILEWRGPISKAVTLSILQLVENTSINSKCKKKLYNVLLENLQNLDNHSSEGDVVVKIQKVQNSYIIVTENYIESAKAIELGTKIDHINSLNESELREFNRQILNNGEFSTKGGAGLGLIDIRRKSQNKLKYQFREDNTKFQLTITIGDES